jgi:DUF1365 family protein
MRPMPYLLVDLVLAGLLLAIGLAAPRDAYAYLDAASGSIILQAALATLFAATVTVRVYWQRLKAYVRGTPPEAPPQQLSNDGK